MNLHYQSLQLKILIIDDDQSLLRVIDHHISSAGFVSRAVSEPLEAKILLETDEYDIILSDLKMPKLSGLDLLKIRERAGLKGLFIVMTGFPSIEKAVEAMKHGAFDFIQKPIDKAHLLRVVEKAREVVFLRYENLQLKSIINDQLDFGNIIARSEGMRKVCTQALQVAPSNVSVLIRGETGTGKELIARAIHQKSRVSKGPFIAMNCAAIPADLLESELFGHTKGAFSGAVTDRMGYFESANTGTLFLDEIGDLPLGLQGKLLRVLQENCIVPLGSSTPRSVQVRVLSATHRNLDDMIHKKQFREDLYYRLNIVSLEIPPLRTRTEDIPLLFNFFLKKQFELEKKVQSVVDKELICVLEKYQWPGNVRELENLARRLVALNCGEIISTTDLPSHFLTNPSTQNLQHPLPEEGIDLEKWIDELVIKALKKNQWNQSKTARYLNISRNTLIYRMEKQGLKQLEENKMI